MAAHHDVVLAAGNDRPEKTELPQRAREAVKFFGADLAGVGGVRVQLVDRNLDDLQIGRGGWH
jgi:hypothetical protein